MRLTTTWRELVPFLKGRRNQSDLSLVGHKGRFVKLKAWFEDKEFTANNYDQFIYYEVDEKGRSNSLYNNYLKLIRHVAAYLEIEAEFKDYHYRDDHTGAPERVVTWEQIVQLAECKIEYKRYKDREIKHKVLIYFLGLVGSRRSETLRIEWRDLILGDQPMIHFRKEITKNKKERDCVISPFLLEQLLTLPRDSKVIFHKIDPKRFLEDLEKRCIAINLPFILTFHDFRDSSINNKLEGGVEIEKVAYYMGHTKIDTTWRYYARIQAKKVAQTLYLKDPAFRSDQTYDVYIQSVTGTLEGIHNPKVSDLVIQERINPETNGREMWFGLVEKQDPVLIKNISPMGDLTDPENVDILSK
jgi:integrase